MGKFLYKTIHNAFVIHCNKCDHNFDLKNVILINRKSLLRQKCIESILISQSSTVNLIKIGNLKF